MHSGTTLEQALDLFTPEKCQGYPWGMVKMENRYKRLEMGLDAQPL